MNGFDIRAIRDALRHQHFAALDAIEDIIARALDRQAEEAVVWGADAHHDFRVNAVAAKAIKQIKEIIERAEAEALR